MDGVTKELRTEIRELREEVKEVKKELQTTTHERSLLDTNEVAEVLGISDRKVRSLISGGELPSLLIGRRRKVRREDVEEFIQKCSEESG